MHKPFTLDADALTVDSFEPAVGEPIVMNPLALIGDPGLGKAETGCVSGCGGSICG